MFKTKSTFRTLSLTLIGLITGPAFAVTTTIVGGVGDLDGSGDGGTTEATLLQAAAACWDARITTNRNFTLNVTGSSLSGGTLGQGATSAVNGSNVPTAGNVTFDNDGSTTWYVGTVPNDTTQFDPVANSQWQFMNGPAGQDLYSTFLHEIGHAHGWLCGTSCGFTNPNYDGMMNPAPGSFVNGATCTSPFPAAGQPALSGCVHLQNNPPQYDVSLRGDGLGGSGSSVVNELSHPGVAGDLMLGFSGGSGSRRTPSEDNVEMFRQAYGDTVNLPPSLNTNNITAECSQSGAANVALNAGATDPENDALTYAWNCGAVALNDPTAAGPNGNFPLGATGCRVDANDLAQCVPNAAELTVTVQDTTPPNIVCPANATVECSAAGGAPATDPVIAAFLAGASANDVCDANLPINNDAPGFFNLGSTPVTFNTADDSGNPASCAANVTVQDTTSPTIESVTATPNSLWPPNHKMQDVTVSVVASDICDANAACQIDSITSDEPVNGDGDGNTSPDWEIVPPLAAKLRAERAGTGDGRVYTLTVKCADASGNSAQKSVEVLVPHDQR
jgi:hypothetical protein